MEVAALPPCAIDAVGKRKGRCFGTASPYLYARQAGPSWAAGAPVCGAYCCKAAAGLDVYNRDKEAARKRQNRTPVAVQAVPLFRGALNGLVGGMCTPLPTACAVPLPTDIAMPPPPPRTTTAMPPAAAEPAAAEPAAAILAAADLAAAEPQARRRRARSSHSHAASKGPVWMVPMPRHAMDEGLGRYVQH